MATGTEDVDPALIALTTLSLLQTRLDRLTFALTGATREQVPSGTETIPTQLKALQSQLTDLTQLNDAGGSLVRMVDACRRQYPDVFNQRALETDTDARRPSHTLAQQATEILAHQSLYTTASAHLQTLETLKVPPARHSALLVEQGERVQALKKRQAKLEAEVDNLKSHSASTLEWWLKNGIVGMSEMVQDWEDRLLQCDRSVKRTERQLQNQILLT